MLKTIVLNQPWAVDIRSASGDGVGGVDTAWAGKAPLPPQAFQALSSHVGWYLGSVERWCVHAGCRGGVGGAVHLWDIFQMAGIWVSRRPPDMTCKDQGGAALPG